MDVLLLTPRGIIMKVMKEPTFEVKHIRDDTKGNKTVEIMDIMHGKVRMARLKITREDDDRFEDDRAHYLFTKYDPRYKEQIINAVTPMSWDWVEFEDPMTTTEKEIR
jgi:hypothetical protein